MSGAPAPSSPLQRLRAPEVMRRSGKALASQKQISEFIKIFRAYFQCFARKIRNSNVITLNSLTI